MSDNKTNGKTSGKKSLKKKKKIVRIVGLALSAVEIIAAIVFAAMIFWLNMVPDKYVIIGIVVLVLITAFIITFRFKHKKHTVLNNIKLCLIKRHTHSHIRIYIFNTL